MLANLLCLFGIHAWDGNTDENYPAPQCTRCKTWHARKYPMALIAMHRVFILGILVNLWLFVLCMINFDVCPPWFGIFVCLGGIVSIISLLAVRRTMATCVP